MATQRVVVRSNVRFRVCGPFAWNMTGTMRMSQDNDAAWGPPVGTDVRLLPAGHWWDAVKVPARAGEFALKLLAFDTGGVIEDTFGGHLYWLIAPGSAARWRLPHVTVLTTACYVAVPPAHRTEGLGVRW